MPFAPHVFRHTPTLRGLITPPDNSEMRFGQERFDELEVQAFRDYLVGIKGNQPKLQAELINFFEQARQADFDGVDVTRCTTEEQGHGRLERREVTVTQALDWLPQREVWNIGSIIEVRSERLIKGKVEAAVRHYASSRTASANDFARFVRGHWTIENNLHWDMDVIFQEDRGADDGMNRVCFFFASAGALPDLRNCTPFLL